MLERFGVRDEACLVYRALVWLPDADTAELSAHTGLTAARLAVAIEELEVRGLVRRRPQAAASEARWSAEPPEPALSPLLDGRHRELEADRAELARLAETFRHGGRGARPGPGLRMLRGRAAVVAGVRHVQEAARHEVRALVRPPVVAVRIEDNVEVQMERMSAGLTYRVIYDQASASSTGGDFQIDASLRVGEQVRVTPDLPLKLVSSDASLAVVSLDDGQEQAADGEPSALLVSHQGVMAMLDGWFEQLWANATPVSAADSPDAAPGDADHPSAADLQLIALVVSGLPDRAIANHLGIATRTVERRVRTLLDRVGVQTRIQLAVHASRSGWV